MALDASSFKKRSLSAVVFVVVMIAGFINPFTFLVLFSVIHFGCWIEYQKLLDRIHPAYQQINFFHRYGIMIAGWAGMLGLAAPDYNLGPVGLPVITGSVVLLFLVIAAAVDIVRKKTPALQMAGLSLAGLLYISFPLGALAFLRNLANHHDPAGHPWPAYGLVLPLIILLCMWVNDTMAYIVGSFIGKTPFSKISPKKTWEGTIGGVILCIVVMGGLAGSVMPAGYWVTPTNWYVIVGIAAVAGTLGDLLESKVKRLAGVKDSGAIMPGHGGFLDRFDSLLVAAPAVWLYVILALS